MSDDANAILILYQSNRPKFKKAETKQVMQGSKCSVILVPENIFTIIYCSDVQNSGVQNNCDVMVFGFHKDDVHYLKGCKPVRSFRS